MSDEVTMTVPDRPVRNPLAARRPHEVFEMDVPNCPKVTVGLGIYDDGRVGEVFITAGKDGSQFAVECADAAVMISLCLQHGLTPQQLYHSMSRTALGTPASVAGHILQQLIERESSQ